LHINKNSTLPTRTRKQLLKCRQCNRVQRNVPSVSILALGYRDQLANEGSPLDARSHGAIGPGRKNHLRRNSNNGCNFPPDAGYLPSIGDFSSGKD
jgi:hypothetical protein